MQSSIFMKLVDIYRRKIFSSKIRMVASLMTEIFNFTSIEEKKQFCVAWTFWVKRHLDVVLEVLQVFWTLEKEKKKKKTEI